MPQLSPLNWLFLFCLFWFVLFLSFSLVWWQKSTSFGSETSKVEVKTSENKWNW